LLCDTIEFTQQAALAAKRGTSDDLSVSGGDKSSIEEVHIIRNLIGTPNQKKSGLSSPDHHPIKGGTGTLAGHFMNVVEHHEEENSEDDEDDDTLGVI